MKIVVVIPTYNEKENIQELMEAILALNLPAGILVVDDNSPDGTGQLVEEIARTTPLVSLLSRASDKGRGRAGIAGFREALAQGADYVIEMDGDLSHDPQFIPALLAKAHDFDVVIGSRFLGHDADQRGIFRKLISRLACFYIQGLLGFKVSDPTSGYRCFKSTALRDLDLDSLVSTGPFIITEVLYRCHRQHYRIGEIPVVLRDRKAGKTKLKNSVLVAYLFKVIKLRLSERIAPASRKQKERIP